VLPLLGEVLPKAVGVAISPVVVVLVILLLVSAHGRATSPGFLGGWMVGVAVLTTAALTLASGVDGDSDSSAQGGFHLVQFALGLVFVLLGVKTWRERPRPGVPAEEPKLFATVDSMSVVKAAGLGFAFATFAAPKNLALELGAGGTIAQGGASIATELLVVLIFTLIASIPVIAPIVAVAVLGDRAAPALDAAKSWLMAHNTVIMLVVFTFLSAHFLGIGLGGLA
jgi:hypothetical protein